MISLTQIQKLLTDSRPETLEALAKDAQRLTEQNFGRTISLYAPVYLSNYCSSHCTYCGFHSLNKIKRIKLTGEETRKEMTAIHATGIRNILLLTGESYKFTPVSYLKEAAMIAKDFFQGIAIEVHPMQTSEYQELYTTGVDGVTIYQETYDKVRYTEVHISGYKKDYDFRRETPARAAAAGIRQISMGILLGLSDVTRDVYELFCHLREMEKSFPGVEYSLSFPRLRTIKGREFAICDIDDRTFLKILCLTRVLFPRVGLNLSTREHPKLRDHLLGIGITKVSAGSNTAVGGYTLKTIEDQDPQFDTEDKRSVAEIVAMIKSKGFDPVFTDWRPIENKA
ncbi:MAG: 2-iminoacetate synthase ThiH [Candidatus Omnitrophica bacterium]|nr:2-iminoacetate synthase ThiH [Candidatus Omnitrophota bacterium]